LYAAPPIRRKVTSYVTSCSIYQTTYNCLWELICGWTKKAAHPYFSLWWC